MTAQKGKDLLVKIAQGAGYVTVAGLRTRRSEQDLVAIFPEELGRGAWLFAE